MKRLAIIDLQQFNDQGKFRYMQNDLRDRRRRSANNLRQVRDITMAIVIIGMSLILFFAPQLGLLENFSETFRLIMGALFAVYGLFRLYRGIKRDY